MRVDSTGRVERDMGRELGLGIRISKNAPIASRITQGMISERYIRLSRYRYIPPVTGYM